MRRTTLSLPNRQAAGAPEPERPAHASEPRVGFSNNVRPVNYQRRVLGINMPEAVNRHHFLGELEKEWKAMGWEKKQFPRAVFSMHMKHSPEQFNEARRNGVPLILLAKAVVNDGLRNHEALLRNEQLNLRSSDLKTLPEQIGKLRQLTALDLEDNRLTALPNTIAHLGNLSILKLRHNQLTSVPEGLASMPHLRQVDLRDNRLTSVPDSLLHIRDAVIDLHRNPLSQEAIEDASSRLETLRRLGHRVPRLRFTDPEKDVVSMHLKQRRDVHDAPVVAFFDSKIEELAAQFPKNLLGRKNRFNNYFRPHSEIRAIRRRLFDAVNLHADDHPEVRKARSAMATMFEKSLGQASPYVNNFKHSPGHVLSYVVLHIERARDRAPEARKEEVFRKGIRLLTSHLAYGHGACDTRKIEEVMTVVSIPFDADDRGDAGTALAPMLSRAQVRDTVYGEAVKTLPKLLAERPDLRQDDERLQKAFRLRVEETIRTEHRAIRPEDAMAYLDEQIIPYWDTFKEAALDAEEKPAAGS